MKKPRCGSVFSDSEDRIIIGQRSSLSQLAPVCRSSKCAGPSGPQATDVAEDQDGLEKSYEPVGTVEMRAKRAFLGKEDLGKSRRSSEFPGYPTPL